MKQPRVRVSASTCIVLQLIAFKKQLFWLFYPVLTLQKEAKWWFLLFALIICCYCLQRLVTSLKLLKPNLIIICWHYIALRRMLLATNNLENILAEKFWLSNKCLIMYGTNHPQLKRYMHVTRVWHVWSEAHMREFLR